MSSSDVDVFVLWFISDRCCLLVANEDSFFLQKCFHKTLECSKKKQETTFQGLDERLKIGNGVTNDKGRTE